MVHDAKIKCPKKRRVTVRKTSSTVDSLHRCSSHLAVGPIIGGVIGGIAVIALLILGYIYVLPRIRKSRFVVVCEVSIVSDWLDSPFRSTTAATGLLEASTISITNPAYVENATSDT
jgi:hypothetical protein